MFISTLPHFISMKSFLKQLELEADHPLASNSELKSELLHLHVALLMYRSNFYLHNPYKYEKHSKIT
jgi:hypothetical protein